MELVQRIVMESDGTGTFRNLRFSLPLVIRLVILWPDEWPDHLVEAIFIFAYTLR